MTGTSQHDANIFERVDVIHYNTPLRARPVA
jgi:hypothetical protein